jgi:hypothetical protein
MEKKQRALTQQDLSDETIRHLQDENRKFLSRKIDTQRVRMRENEDKLYDRHCILSRLQEDLIAKFSTQSSSSSRSKRSDHHRERHDSRKRGQAVSPPHHREKERERGDRHHR